MKDLLNDFDIWQEALKKIDLNESALPIYNGKMLFENAKTYMQMQKILACEPMQRSHKFCLNLNPENLTEEEVRKVDRLYSLGVDRGFINDDIDSLDDECSAEECCDGDNCCDGDECCGGYKCQNDVEKPTSGYRMPKYSVKIPCYTIMYSAMKDGSPKTGETYSNAVNPYAAKADAMAKLSRVGYQNISILAIECGDPDSCGFEDSYTQEDDVMTKAVNSMDNKFTSSPYEPDAISDNAEPINETIDATADTDAIVDDILNEYEGEDSSEEPKKEDSKSEEKSEEPKKEEPKKEEPKEDTSNQESKDTDDTFDLDAPIDEQPSNSDSTESNDDEMNAMMDDAISQSSGEQSDSSEKSDSNDGSEQSSNDQSQNQEDGSNEKSDSEEHSNSGESLDDQPLAGSDGSGAEDAQEDTESDNSKSQPDLDEAQRAALKEDYTRMFKNVMMKLEFDGRSFDELQMNEKTQVFEEILKAWSTNKPDPTTFMSKNETDQLYAIKIEA